MADADNCCSGSSMAQSTSSIQIYTHNITRRPVAWDAARQRPTQEVVHAIHSALHFALDPCVNHADEAPSFCVVDVKSPSPPEKRLIIPCEDDMKASRPMIDPKGELSVKLFAGFKGAPLTRADIDEALDALHRATGTREVAKFVIGLENVRWVGCSDEGWEVAMEEVEALKDVWEHISDNASLGRLGVSDFSPSHLSRLYQVLSPHCVEGLRTNKAIRKPTIDQLNFDGSVPSKLTEFARREGVELVSHSDELGTSAQLVNVLGEFEELLPLPAHFAEERAKHPERAMRVKWILKYTVFLRERSLVSCKGYILSCSF